jgi:hypothetical protein
MRNGEPIVFFTSFDRLAAGAEEDNASLYEWSHDQVFLIAGAPSGLAAPALLENGDEFVGFVDASEEATDLFFRTPASLNWENGGGRQSIYTARIGGGFTEPARPPAPCDPSGALSCLGSPAAPIQAPSAGSTTFNGPGSAKHKKQKHKKHRRHKKHKQHGKHKKHGQKKHKQGRHSIENRRAGE